MYVSEIKEKYPLVYERIAKQTDKNLSDEGLSVITVFNWSHTTEGSTFWFTVDKGDWSRAKELQPHLFEEDNRLVKIIINGLFK